MAVVPFWVKLHYFCFVVAIVYVVIGTTFGLTWWHNVFSFLRIGRLDVTLRPLCVFTLLIVRWNSACGRDYPVRHCWRRQRDDVRIDVAKRDVRRDSFFYYLELFVVGSSQTDCGVHVIIAVGRDAATIGISPYHSGYQVSVLAIEVVFIVIIVIILLLLLYMITYLFCTYLYYFHVEQKL